MLLVLRQRKHCRRLDSSTAIASDVACRDRYDKNNGEFAESSLSVLVGLHDVTANSTSEPSRRRHAVRRIVIHDKYTRGRQAYDAMLFRVSPGIQFNDRTRPICVDKSVFPAGKTCVVTGWGSVVNVGTKRNIEA